MKHGLSRIRCFGTAKTARFALENAFLRQRPEALARSGRWLICTTMFKSRAFSTRFLDSESTPSFSPLARGRVSGGLFYLVAAKPHWVSSVFICGPKFLNSFLESRAPPL